MIRALLLLLALASTARGETVRVLSGEHADFTRLVIELPGTGNWTVGRTAKGYGFATRAAAQPEYDLSTVWQRIRRNRLQSLDVDPQSGALLLGLGCDCHLFPFEYDSGIVVLDIKDGPPPPGSIFEAPLVPAIPSGQTGVEATYDWISDFKTGRPKAQVGLPLALDTGSVSLEPLRDELLEQIARGAADGVVDMELPGKPAAFGEASDADLPWAQIRIGEQAGVAVSTPNGLIPDAENDPACAPDDLLNLPAWGEGRMPHDLLAEARDGLFGEFDAPNEEAVLRSVRQLLYLGFGVEALQHAELLGSETADPALPLYRSMARLVDGDADPQTPFARMLDCDGPAALWAALAHDRLPAGPGVNRGAILQAYQSLPAHLRRHLGPGLAERFLARDDVEAVRIIRDAMERAADAEADSIALLDAKAELSQGNVEAARTHAEAAVALDGDRADNLVALVETHFRKLQPISADIPEALQGLRSEVEAAGPGVDLDRAIVLSLALSDQIDASFAEPAAQSVLADLWQVVVARAADDAFLLQAVLPKEAARPDVPADVRLSVARRLLTLKFPDAALVWVGPVTPSDPPEIRLIAARAELGRGNNRAAVTLVEGLQDAAASEVRAEALLQLGDLAGAADELARAGASAAASRAEIWQGNWQELDPEAPETWRLAADQAKPADPEATGLLGRGSQSVDASIASRNAIEALLASVPTPPGN